MRQCVQSTGLIAWHVGSTWNMAAVCPSSSIVFSMSCYPYYMGCRGAWTEKFRCLLFPKMVWFCCIRPGVSWTGNSSCRLVIARGMGSQPVFQSDCSATSSWNINNHPMQEVTFFCIFGGHFRRVPWEGAHQSCRELIEILFWLRAPDSNASSISVHNLVGMARFSWVLKNFWAKSGDSGFSPGLSSDFCCLLVTVLSSRFPLRTCHPPGMKSDHQCCHRTNQWEGILLC